MRSLIFTRAAYLWHDRSASAARRNALQFLLGSASSYKDEYFDYNITVFIIFSADRMYSSGILQLECVEGGSSSQSLVSVSVVVCIFQLCSRTRDIHNELCLFYWRRIDRGYHQEGLIPLFMKGVLNTESYILHWHRTNKTRGRKLKLANATSAYPYAILSSKSSIYIHPTFMAWPHLFTTGWRDTHGFEELQRI